jgi:serine phosphatase RsbU (regulator of sigma subunit)
MSIYLSPEISSKRVSGIILASKSESNDLILKNPFHEWVDEETYSHICKDPNFWIPQALEEKIIEKISQFKDISPLLRTMGKETSIRGIYDLLPLDASSIDVNFLLIRIPIFINRFTRCIQTDVEIVSPGNALFKFKYLEGYQEKWYDVFFFQGILDGVSILFELENTKIELLKTKLYGILANHKDLGNSIQFGADSNEFRFEWNPNQITIQRPRIDPPSEKPIQINKGDEEGLTFTNPEELIEKSRMLSMENRELEASLEVMKTFKHELEKKQKAMEKDLRLAKNIQKGIIPQDIPDWKGIQFWSYFRPMQDVSGDYFDYIPLYDEDKLAIFICDVSGHGVPAAFITALSKMLFMRFRGTPSEIFRNINREMLELLKLQGYTTSLYIQISNDYKINYSIAGHPRPYVVREDGTLEQLAGEGTLLGMFADAGENYEDYTAQLYPGDKIFLFTDGIIEGENVDGEDFGYERLEETLRYTVGMDVNEAAHFVTATFEQFCMGNDRDDDVTLLVFGLSPQIPEYQKHMSDADSSYKDQDFQKAISQYESAYKIFPRELNVLSKLGKSYAKIKDYDKAIEHLVAYSDFKTKNHDSHLVLGYCYYKTGNYKKAEEEFKKAMTIKDDSIPTLYNLAKAYIKTGQKVRAVSLLSKILKLEPGFQRAKLLIDKITVT